MKLQTAELERQATISSSLDDVQLDRLGQILDDLLVQSEAGHTPDVESVCRSHPDLAEAIRYYVRSIQLLHQVAFDGRADSKFALKQSTQPSDPNTLGAEDHRPNPLRPQDGLRISSSELSAFEQDVLGELGDFKLIREIGRGGMGVVYEARQLSLARRVALKILPFAAVLDSRQIARFQNEAQAAASLQHPNIVPVFSVGNDRGTHFYSMQYVDGHSLDLIVQQLQDKQPAQLDNGTQGSRSDATNDKQAAQSTVNAWAAASTVNSHRSTNYIHSVVKLFIQAADALHYAHQHGIVHRDVKPSNLMVDNQGKLWVTDFGLAQCRLTSDGSNPAANLTRSGDFLGTLRYMSAEQTTGKSHLVDHRTDVYSLGATLYELLTLQPVVTGSERMEMIRQIDQGIVRPPSKLNTSIPIALENIIAKSLSTSRDDRYGSAEEFADDLRRFVAGDAPLAKRPGWLDRASRLARKNPRASLLTMLGLVVVIAISVFMAATLQSKNSQIQAALDRADQHLAVANQAVYRFGPMQLRRLELLAGSESLRLETAREALNYFRSFTTYAQADPELQQQVANAQMICGDLELQLGDFQSASQHFQAAVNTFEKLRSTSRNGAGQGDQFIVDLLLGRNNLAVSQARAGDLGTAKETLEGSLPLLVQIDLPSTLEAKQSATQIRLVAVEVLTRLHLGQVAADSGDTGRADSEFRKALRLADAVQVAKSSATAAPSVSDEIYSLVIATLLETSRLPHMSAEQSVPTIESALALAERLDRENAITQSVGYGNLDISQITLARTITQRDVALCRLALGSQLLSANEFTKARNVLLVAEREFRTIHRSNQMIQQIGIDYATALNNLGQCELELNNLIAAEEWLSKSEKLLTQIRSFANSFLVEHSLGGVYNNLSIASQRQGEIEKAKQLIDMAIDHQLQALQLSPGNSVCQAFLEEHKAQRAALREQTDLPTPNELSNQQEHSTPTSVTTQSFNTKQPKK